MASGYYTLEITLLQLPVDILIHIFKKLDLEDLRNVMLTCKTLKDLIVNDNSIWRLASREKLILHNSSDNKQTIPFSWYHRCRVSHNWSYGIFKSKIVVYHQTNYMPWLKYHNSEVLLLSVGSELRCYPTDSRGIPNSKQQLWTLNVPTVKRDDVRTNDISRFTLKNDLLVCGNRDGCVASYKVNDVKCKPLLESHIMDCHENGQVEVTAVELICCKDRTCLITSSESSPQIRFWYSISDEKLSSTKYVKQIPVVNTSGVRCLAVNKMEDRLAMGPNGNSKPLLLDVTIGELLLTQSDTQNPKQAVRDVQWHNENTIMYVTHSGLLQLLDVRSGQLVYKAADPFQSTLYCGKSDSHDAIVVGSSEYSRCVLFDTRKSAHHVQMYFTQKKSSPIYSLDFDSTKLIAAADRSIAALNFNVNPSSAQQRDYSRAFEIVSGS